MIIVIIIIIIVIITIQRGQKTCFTFPLKFKIWALTDHISEAVKDPFTFKFRIVIYVIIFPNLRQKIGREKSNWRKLLGLMAPLSIPLQQLSGIWAPISAMRRQTSHLEGHPPHLLPPLRKKNLIWHTTLTLGPLLAQGSLFVIYASFSLGFWDFCSILVVILENKSREKRGLFGGRFCSQGGCVTVEGQWTQEFNFEMDLLWSCMY